MYRRVVDNEACPASCWASCNEPLGATIFLAKLVTNARCRPSAMSIGRCLSGSVAWLPQCSSLSHCPQTRREIFRFRPARRYARCIWRDQSKHTEARDLLAPVYNWFPEGFDTPVLREAKLLFDELR